MKKIFTVLIILALSTFMYAQQWYNYSSATVLDAIEWNGDLWIATENGLQRYHLQDNLVDKYLSSNSGLPDNEPLILALIIRRNIA